VSLDSRQDLTRRVESFGQVAPGNVLLDPSERMRCEDIECGGSTAQEPFAAWKVLR